MSSELGVHAGGDDDADTRATRDTGSLEQHRGPIGDARVPHGSNRLVDASRLARQGRFVDVKVRCFGKPQIRGNQIARVQKDDVARHQVFRRNQARVRSRHTRVERVPSALSASMDRRALISVRKPMTALSASTPRSRRLVPIRQRDRQRGRGGEQIDHGAFELMQRYRERTDLLSRHDRIRPVGPEPALHLLVNKACSHRDAEPCGHFAGRQGMAGSRSGPPMFIARSQVTSMDDLSTPARAYGSYSGSCRAGGCPFAALSLRQVRLRAISSPALSARQE